MLFFLDFPGSSSRHKVDQSGREKPAGTVELLRGHWGREWPKATQ